MVLCRWAVFYALGYDLVFYAGHRAMHYFPFKLYDSLHRLHHSSYATCGVSHHYMTPIDYLLEVILPAVIPLMVLGVYAPSFGMFLGIGGWNGVVVHSGWDLPLCPNPTDHFTHHVHYYYNYALGYVTSSPPSLPPRDSRATPLPLPLPTGVES